MFDPASLQLLEQQYGGDDDQPWGNAAPTRNGGTTAIMVGGDNDQGYPTPPSYTDVNHNSAKYSSNMDYLKVPGSSSSSTYVQSSRKLSRSPNRNGAKSPRRSPSPRAQMHSSGQRHSSRAQMQSTGGQMNSPGGQMHSTGGQMSSARGQMNSPGGQMISARGQMHSPGFGRQSPGLRSSFPEAMHSPGGQSDVSWASLPSEYKGPFPPGKDPVNIKVQSPSPSEASMDSLDRRRVREVQTIMPTQPPVAEPTPKAKKFLRKVQEELEDQRGKWKDDVDKLTGGMVGLEVEGSPNGMAQGTSSYVETSSGQPIFKAAVDVSGYRPENITVTVDKLANKAVVQAIVRDHTGFPTRTFTQRVQLPRYADDQRMTTKLSKRGKLKLEVPLIYYFDDIKKTGRKAKSFVYQVNEAKDGSKQLEILVNTGSGYRARDLKIQVHDDNKLVIIGHKQGERGLEKKLIKQYTLPAFANVDGISSKLGKDGRLQVNVPLQKIDSNEESGN